MYCSTAKWPICDAAGAFSSYPNRLKLLPHCVLPHLPTAYQTGAIQEISALRWRWLLSWALDNCMSCMMHHAVCLRCCWCVRPVQQCTTEGLPMHWLHHAAWKFVIAPPMLLLDDDRLVWAWNILLFSVMQLDAQRGLTHVLTCAKDAAECAGMTCTMLHLLSMLCVCCAQAETRLVVWSECRHDDELTAAHPCIMMHDLIRSVASVRSLSVWVVWLLDWSVACTLCCIEHGLHSSLIV